MNRQEIYEKIEKERSYQEAAWPRTERRQQMYKFSAPHLLLLEEKVARMRSMWYNGDITPAEFIKVAAIAVRALEEASDIFNKNEDQK